MTGNAASKGRKQGETSRPAQALRAGLAEAPMGAKEMAELEDCLQDATGEKHGIREITGHGARKRCHGGRL